MARKRKAEKPLNSRSIRLSDDDQRDAERAARLETQRTGRAVGWTKLIADGGMARVRRILRRAERAVQPVPAL